MTDPDSFDREFKAIRSDRADFELPHGLIHVWEGIAPVDPIRYRQFYEILDDSERQRAERFRAEHHRIRFVSCHGWLRLLLAGYTGRGPAEIHLEIGDYGKPRLNHTKPNTGLVFNVSHSAERILFGFGLDCMLGVDIERCRNLSHLEAMVERICSDSEKRDFLNMPADCRAEFFFRLWVRKEAIVKAHGRGFSLGLRECVLSSDLDRPISLPDPCGDTKNWTLFDLHYPDDFRGAIAVSPERDSVLRRALPERLLSLYLCR